MLSTFLLVKAKGLSVLPLTGPLAHIFACAHKCAQAVPVDKSALWEVGVEAYGVVGRGRWTESYRFPFLTDTRHSSLGSMNLHPNFKELSGTP